MENFNKNVATIWIPIIGIIIGSVLGLILNPSPNVLNYVRMLTMGIVLAAAATELLPKVANVTTTEGRIFVILGLILSAALLIGVRLIFGKYTTTFKKSEIPYDLIVSLGFDFLVTAFLIGISSNLGGDITIVLSISLGIQMFLLTLTLSHEMQKHNIPHIKIFYIILFITFIVLIGAILGYYIGKSLRGNPIYYLMLAFGAASLIWLVTEELLVFNQEKSNINLTLATSLVFIGFISVIVIRWLTPF